MYSSELRKQAIDLHNKGTPAPEICKQLGIGRSTLFLWLQQADPNHPQKASRKEYLEKTELERLRFKLYPVEWTPKIWGAPLSGQHF